MRISCARRTRMRASARSTSRRAAKAPGVVRIVTGRDLAEWTTVLRMAPPIEGLHPVEMTTLPIDKVRFIGDPVVCIVARDRYLAEDAAELVDDRLRAARAGHRHGGRARARRRAGRRNACRRT